MAFLRNLTQAIPQQFDRNDPLGRGLIFWAPLTEHAGTFCNSVGTSNVRGTFTGTAAWASGGPTGSCVSIPGDGSTINFSSPNSSVFLGPLSLSIWFKPTNFTNYNGLLTKTQSNNAAPLDWYTTSGSGQPVLTLGNPGVGFAQVTSTAPIVGLWNHMVVTLTSTYHVDVPFSYHYLNGAISGSGGFGSFSGDGSVGTDNLLIGNRNDNFTKANGYFADARIYARCLTPNDVRMLYLDALRPMLARRRVIVPKPAAVAAGYRARVVRWG